MSEQHSLAFRLTRPQYKAAMIDTQFVRAIWGRGTGKTTGLVAPRAMRNVLNMPRSCGAILGATYGQLLVKTMPPVIAAWEAMGYKRDKHFFIGRKPSAKLRFDNPYIQPLSYEYFIHFINGSGIYLLSQDRPGSANGLSIDWAIADETKLLKKDRLFEELIPAIRGNKKHFGELPCHGSTLFCSDMPTTKAAMWLLDEQRYHKPEVIELILQMQYQLSQIELKMIDAKPGYIGNLKAQANKIKAWLNEARFNTTYFSMASSWDNVELIGEQQLKRWRRELPDIIYRTSVLNQPLTLVEQGFYPAMDDDKHYYANSNLKALHMLHNYDTLKETDCSFDNDINVNKPLDIACDFGGSINLVVVGQEYARPDGYREYRFLNSFYKLHPGLIQDSITAFCVYYSSFSLKTVNFYYDHTAVGAFANITETYADTVASTFKKYGWKCNMIYVGQALSHEARYNKWDEFLKSDGFTCALPKFNRINAHYVIVSMEQAQIKQTTKGIEKNKNDEKIKGINQATTTHHSDAADTLLMGNYVNKNVKASRSHTPVVFG